MLQQTGFYGFVFYSYAPCSSQRQDERRGHGVCCRMPRPVSGRASAALQTRSASTRRTPCCKRCTRSWAASGRTRHGTFYSVRLPFLPALLSTPSRPSCSLKSRLVTFAAASTLVVATMCPDLQVGFDTEPARTSWERALRIFDFHKRHVASAARGIEVLERFRASVVNVSRNNVQLGKTFAGKSATGETDIGCYYEDQNQETQAEERGEAALPFSSGPISDQTAMAQDFGDFLNSDLLNESWLNMQGIDFGSWSVFP